MGLRRRLLTSQAPNLVLQLLNPRGLLACLGWAFRPSTHNTPRPKCCGLPLGRGTRSVGDRLWSSGTATSASEPGSPIAVLTATATPQRCLRTRQYFSAASPVPSIATVVGHPNVNAIVAMYRPKGGAGPFARIAAIACHVFSLFVVELMSVKHKLRLGERHL